MGRLSRRAFVRVVSAGAWLGSTIGVTTPPRRASAAAGDGVGDAAQADFAFVHLSDTHLDSRPARLPYRSDGRSVGVLDWFARRAGLTIDPNGRVGGLGVAPSFAIHTGDVFEYSVVDNCWEDWGRAIEEADCPFYCVAGNHDNTWASINGYLRSLYGGDSYSFDHGGCHFVCLNSAGSLDPLPCWDARTLNWLANDLAQVDEDTPVLLAFHHPLSDNAGYASEYDKLRFWEVIRRHRVVVMMDGHWHRVQADTWQNIPRVNGGETYRKNPGYATVRVSDGKLVQRYHFHESADGGARDKLVLRTRIDRPAPRFNLTLSAQVGDGASDLQVSGTIGANDTGLFDGEVTVSARIDGGEYQTLELEQSDEADSPLRFLGRLSIGDAAPGRHFVSVRVERPDRKVRLRSRVGKKARNVGNEQAVEFDLPHPVDSGVTATRFQGAAGVRTPLLLVGGDDGPGSIVFGDTSGRVTALDADSMQPIWFKDTGKEILGSLSLCGERVAACDTDGTLHFFDSAEGTPLSTVELGAPVFGAGTVVGETLYLGEANGGVVAVDLKSAEIVWRRDVADFALESAPTYDANNDLLLLGSWDGFLYAVARATGETVWKSWGPTGAVAAKSRYYGPADCAAVLVGDELWATDRGFRLGRYRASDGAWLGLVEEEVGGIGPVWEGNTIRGAVSRGRQHTLTRYDEKGGVVWTAKVPLGRSPRPPVHAQDAGVVGVVSDTGLLSVVDAETGELTLRHSLTPSLFVQSGLSYFDATRSWYAAGMDGVVSRVAT